MTSAPHLDACPTCGERTAHGGRYETLERCAQVEVDRLVAVHYAKALDYDPPGEVLVTDLWAHLRGRLTEYAAGTVSESGMATEIVKVVAALGWRPITPDTNPGP